MSAFQGIPEAAADFFAELETNNNRDWWVANRGVYEAAVRAPMLLLAGELEKEFGKVKVFRPNRDVRFSPDKTPYKNHQGLVAETGTGMGWYAQISARGLMTAGGWYACAPDQLDRYREAVTDDESGGSLQRLVEDLDAADFDIDGEVLKTRPRGVSPDHPRLGLLRHKSLTAAMEYGIPEWLESAVTLDRILADWRALRPLMSWLAEHVGSSTRHDHGPGRRGVTGT